MADFIEFNAYVDDIGLEDFIAMGQDWGGPVGMGVATERAARVRGVVLGNTWFWPPDRQLVTVASKLLSSQPLKRLILDTNQFVPRLCSSGQLAS